MFFEILQKKQVSCFMWMFTWQHSAGKMEKYSACLRLLLIMNTTFFFWD